MSIIRARLVCPKDPKHKKFVGTAHLAEDWILDEHGDWLDSLEPPQVMNYPDWDWIHCADCDTQAKVVQD